MYYKEKESNAVSFFVGDKLYVLPENAEKAVFVAEVEDEYNYELQITHNGNAVLFYDKNTEKLYRVDLQTGEKRFIARCREDFQTDFRGNGFYFFQDRYDHILRYTSYVSSDSEKIVCSDVESYVVDGEHDRVIVLSLKGWTKYSKSLKYYMDDIYYEQLKERSYQSLGFFDGKTQKFYLLSRHIKDFVLSKDLQTGYFIKSDGLYYFDVRTYQKPVKVYEPAAESQFSLEATDEHNNIFFIENNVFYFAEFDTESKTLSCKKLFDSDGLGLNILNSDITDLYLTSGENTKEQCSQLVCDDCIGQSSPKLDKLREKMTMSKNRFTNALYHFDGKRLIKMTDDLHYLSAGYQESLYTRFVQAYIDLTRAIYSRYPEYKGNPIAILKRSEGKVKLSEIQRYIDDECERIQTDIYRKNEMLFNYFQSAIVELGYQYRVLDVYVCINGCMKLLIPELIPSYIDMPHIYDNLECDYFQTDSKNGLMYVLDVSSEIPKRKLYQVPIKTIANGETALLCENTVAFKAFSNGTAAYTENKDASELEIWDAEVYADGVGEILSFYAEEYRQDNEVKYELKANCFGSIISVTKHLDGLYSFAALPNEKIAYVENGTLYIADFVVEDSLFRKRTVKLSKKIKTAENVTSNLIKTAENDIENYRIQIKSKMNLNLPYSFFSG